MTAAEAPARGRFLVLDGVDGCGKSTQAERLVRRLSAAADSRGRPAPVHLREPGSTPLGEGVRALLLDRDHAIGPAVEALLFAAARRQMLEERVRPALAEGRDVVCERFHPSTLAYQGVAGGLGEERVVALLETWCGEPRPDRILVIDTDVEEAARRRGADGDRIEDKGLEYQRRVAEGYRAWTRRDDRTVLVDGSGDAVAVERRIAREVPDGG